mgnify:CR=1 FL=1
MDSLNDNKNSSRIFARELARPLTDEDILTIYGGCGLAGCAGTPDTFSGGKADDCEA